MKQREPESKNLKLSLEDIGHSSQVLRALGSPQRLRIVALLGSSSMNVQEIARAAGLPLSTTAAHIRVLEDAGVLMSESVPSVRGAMKLCSRRLDQLTLQLFQEEQSDEAQLTLHMPLGGYSRVLHIKPTCGLVSRSSAIGDYDNPRSFYAPNRFEAQLMWFRQGFVEYRFGMLPRDTGRLSSLELSFEACSEAPMYRNPWKSDLSVYINEIKVGSWLSPADLGGRRGLLNPAWWSDTMTQYGYLLTWRISAEGSFVNDGRVSAVTLDQLNLSGQDCITVRIGVDQDAEHQGGMNLFGEGFGDYAQALVMRIGYRPD